jgi:hypothetical protein
MTKQEHRIKVSIERSAMWEAKRGTNGRIMVMAEMMYRDDGLPRKYLMLQKCIDREMV